MTHFICRELCKLMYHHFFKSRKHLVKSRHWTYELVFRPVYRMRERTYKLR